MSFPEEIKEIFVTDSKYEVNCLLQIGWKVISTREIPNIFFDVGFWRVKRIQEGTKIEYTMGRTKEILEKGLLVLSQYLEKIKEIESK